MSRFQSTFQRLRAERACGLFPYLMAGFPDISTSQALAETAIAAGADGFEVAVPFSDPMADGATLQRANARALDGGATVRTALELARFIRARTPSAPVALMSYYNPIMQAGEEAFAESLAEAGADGVIVPDLPAEEARALGGALAARGLDLALLVAPTSPEERLRRIAAAASGFLYCVSLVGVTGARSSLAADLGDFLGRVRAAAGGTPLVVGFGISRPEHVRHVADLRADGVIVASALVDLVERSRDPVQAAGEYLRQMKDATQPSTVA